MLKNSIINKRFIDQIQNLHYNIMDMWLTHSAWNVYFLQLEMNGVSLLWEGGGG